MIWYVYLLLCKDESFYCGITNNLQERLKKHNLGKGAKYTRARLPVTLLGFVKVKDKSEALKLELQIKKMKKQDKLLFFKKGE